MHFSITPVVVPHFVIPATLCNNALPHFAITLCNYYKVRHNTSPFRRLTFAILKVEKEL